MNLLDQRVYHVTHLRNLKGILATDAVLAADGLATRAAESSTAGIPVDLSSPLTRELRSSVEVGPAVEGGTASSVSAHVPWYLSPDASVWQELRRGAAEPRWSAAARAAASVDLVVLVSTVRTLVALGGFAIADGDGAATFTRFATDEGQAMRMLSRLHNTDHLFTAEVLIAGSVPFAAVQLIGVANDPQRDRVRTMLDGASARPKVAVYPPWFAAPE
ncbi:MAG: DarT ssDNA thymidine ADP-ribosyltransferase family protein [Rhodoglobus sp.]|nr:DarT ssDNA thymidine ADP-ribosyltransferase family protein [Rhodoglobus sp.]